MNTQIGIKLADGKFYPILEDGTASRKRLVVTTVRDNQQSVQIDVYRGSGGTTAGADYIGSLVIEKISAAAKGIPDIRLDLGLDAAGMLDAYAEDMASGQHQSLEVSLQSLEEEEKYEIPDFAFEEAETDTLPASAALPVAAEKAAEAPPAAPAEVPEAAVPSKPAAPADRIGSAETAALLSRDSTAEALEKEEQKEKAKKRLPKILLLILLAAALVLLVLWLLQRCGTQKTAEAAPVQTAEQEEPLVISAVPEPAAEPVPAAQPAAPAETPAAPVQAPAAEPKKGGVWYRLHWGDTLWDLSYSFYQNPWLYPKIARANKIKNPDYIISGTKIWIPER